MTASGTYGNNVNNNSSYPGGSAVNGDPFLPTFNLQNSFTMNHQQQPQQTASNIAVSPSSPNAVELTENFYINNNNKKKHNLKIQVQLNGTGIYLRRETPDHDQITEQLIRIEDIIGSHCGGKVKKRNGGVLNSCKRLRKEDDEEQHHSEDSSSGSSQQEHKDISAYLYIYAYVRKEKPLRRMRTVRILRFRSFVTYEDNLKSAERWQRAIKINKGQDPLAGFEVKKPLLILLNPKSGSGKGRVLFQKHVAPVFKEAGVQYDLVVTTHANFARELIRRRKDLTQKYSGIVVASGDGLFFEVLNGIMERPDWRVLTRDLPLGIIPCGSGNGLAKSIAHLYNEPYEPKPLINASLTCVSGHWAPLDVVRVEIANKQQQSIMYSFLSVGWGIIADIDIESERLRSLGPQRFTLWAVHRILHLKTHKGKLSYLPWKKTNEAKSPFYQPQQQHHNPQPRRSGTSSILKRFHDALDDEHDFMDARDEENEREDDNDEFADIVSRSTSRPDSWASAKSNATAYYSIAGHSLRSNRSAATIQSKIEAANAEFLNQAPQPKTPALDSQLPADWHSEEGEFVMVHAAYTTHLGSDTFFAPDSKLNDGIIYLVVIRAGIGKSQLAQFLINMSSGTHLAEAPTSHIQVIPVTAFRIEPHDQEGILNVDGERVPYGALQAEIFPGIVKAMVPNGLSH